MLSSATEAVVMQGRRAKEATPLIHGAWCKIDHGGKFKHSIYLLERKKQQKHVNMGE